MTTIVDTNVIRVANGQHEGVSPACTANCAVRLHDLMQSGRIAVDDAYRILTEYQNKPNQKTGKGPGDAFVRWVLQNSANPSRCEQVNISEHAERGFEEFPEDKRLACFDASDRKFVAVAVAHPDHPPILQAADSKWLGWEAALKDHSVEVEFLCPKDIQQFYEKKFGK